MNLLSFLRLNTIKVPSYFSSDEGFRESKVQKTKNFLKKVNFHLRISKEKMVTKTKSKRRGKRKEKGSGGIKED